MATRRSNPSRRIAEPVTPVGSAPSPSAPGMGSSAGSSKASTEARPARHGATTAKAPAAPVAARIAVSVDARRALIAKAAYLRAERRGFAPGFEEEDWLTAEKEVDALLSAGQGIPQ
jgi:hypothetical protein